MKRDAEKLRRLRAKIDAADTALMSALKKRMEIVQVIGAYKRAHGLAPLDRARRDEVMRTRLSKGRAMRLSPTLVRKLFSLIHDHSVETEKRAPRS